MSRLEEDLIAHLLDANLDNSGHHRLLPALTQACAGTINTWPPAQVPGRD